ncbi:MAG: HTTM domain-containing protein [Bacteroidota bacterium]
MKLSVHRLFEPVDNAPLILFRICFGFLITAEAWGAILTGWVKANFVDPTVPLQFIDFRWLKPLPSDGMYYYFIIMGIAGVMVMLGLYYRAAMTTYAIMWSVVYLMQKTSYNNHYYLLMLLCMVMIFLPANAYKSLDVRLKPSIKKLTCPRWCIWFFVVQVSIVYIYASIAKIYPDWLRADPISIWFDAKSSYPIIGPVLQFEWVRWGVAYGGIMFDMLIAPAMLWRRTRVYAFWVAVFFHLFNSAVFQIGIFPFLGIALFVFFFEPETIRRIFFKKKPTTSFDGLHLYDTSKPLVYLFAIWFAIQIALPLRHLMFPGNANWTEEGHRLSWHMMLRAKNGYVRFIVKDPSTGEEWKVRPTEFLTKKQARVIAIRPDMCWQFVQFLKQKYQEEGREKVEIYAKGKARLNKRPYQDIYDSNVDLASVEWKKFEHADWIVPLRDE